MPDKNEKHLPDYKWASVYRKCVQHLKNNFAAFPSEAAFNAAVSTERPNIKIRQFKRFAKCTLCADLDKKIGETTGFIRKKWEYEKDQHLEWMGKERAKYYKHREKARSQPLKYMSISIDGMDNSKTQLPSFARETKGTACACITQFSFCYPYFCCFLYVSLR